MVIKEIRDFVIDQMRNGEWSSDQWSNKWVECKSRFLDIKITRNSVHFFIKSTSYNRIELTRDELGISKIYFWWLLRGVRKSCLLSDKRKRDKQLENQWKSFLDKNKDIRRDSTIDKILD